MLLADPTTKRNMLEMVAENKLGAEQKQQPTATRFITRSQHPSPSLASNWLGGLLVASGLGLAGYY